MLWDQPPIAEEHEDEGDNDPPVPAHKLDYNRIRDICQMEENMSINPKITHPGILLVDLPDWVLRGWGNDGNDARAHGSGAADVDGHGGEANEGSSAPLPFDELGLHIQAKIFAYLLHFEGELVHPMSRLDYFAEPPKDLLPPDEELRKRSGLPKRFFFTSRERTMVNITSGSGDGRDHRPEQVLKLLLVSKRWLFLGVHVFYGLNTFAFSSLGEFGRFAKGIGIRRLRYVSLLSTVTHIFPLAWRRQGDAKTQRRRVRHVEITWVGSQRLSFPARHERTQEELDAFLERSEIIQYRHRSSRRTAPCRWLCEMPTLRTLVIHIHESERDDSGCRRGESGESEDSAHRRSESAESGAGGDSCHRGYRRRGHETQDTVAHLQNATEHQPNYRGFRSLRTCQGFDYVCALRGLDFIRIYDLALAVFQDRFREPIRDISFLRDLQHCVTQPRRNPVRLEDLESIFPVLPGGPIFVPTERDWELLRLLYGPDDRGLRFNTLDRDVPPLFNFGRGN